MLRKRGHRYYTAIKKITEIYNNKKHILLLYRRIYPSILSTAHVPLWALKRLLYYCCFYVFSENMYHCGILFYYFFSLVCLPEKSCLYTIAAQAFL